MQSNSIRYVARIPLLRNLEGNATRRQYRSDIIVGYTRVDDIDAKYLAQFEWRVCIDERTSYAFRRATAYGRTFRIKMHNVVWERYYGEIPKGYTIDHIDHDGLNNQIANLRLATHAQQIRNQKPSRRNTSGYRGVSRDRKDGQYKATIRSGELFFLGRYATAEEAAVAYNYAASKISGEFAWRNPIPAGAVADTRASEIIADMDSRYLPRIEAALSEEVERTYTLRPDGTESNHRVRRDSKTGYRGVTKEHKYDFFRASIRSGGKLVFLGNYSVKEEGAVAYNYAAAILFGDKARLNPIPDGAVSGPRIAEIIAALDAKYLPKATVV